LETLTIILQALAFGALAPGFLLGNGRLTVLVSFMGEVVAVQAGTVD
jgi:hypothetical protein